MPVEKTESVPAETARPPVDQRLSRDERLARQADRLGTLLPFLFQRSPFYRRKWEAGGVDPAGLRFPDDWTSLPATTKAELVADQEAHAPWGTVLTEPLDHYVRYWQTSSTTGRPMRWLDTAESWRWVSTCWQAVFHAAGVTARDRIFFPFGFGPFLGFWGGFDAAVHLGALAIPGGGMSSEHRLGAIRSIGATVICCTPSYALRLAEVAAIGEGGALAAGTVRAIIVAGEPGGSIPATRHRIEQAWGARVFDHYGLTEVGPVGFECEARPGGFHLNEAEYVCEVVVPGTDDEASDGEPGELIVTNLGRAAAPVIRYRTNDIVSRRTGPCACGRTLAWLEGGILTRADDMVVVRGVNVYPAAIEAVLRQMPEIAEFRATVGWRGPLRALSLEIEPVPGCSDLDGLVRRVVSLAHEAIGLTLPVRVMEQGALPRFEMKARRFVIEP